MTTFSDIVDATDRLSTDEKQVLVELLRRRIADENRKRLVQDVKEGREEYARGECREGTADEIIDEALL